MKPFFYTLILTVILVTSVIYLRSMQTPTPVVDRESVLGEASPLPTPMKVNSDAAALPSMDPEFMESANREQLYLTGVELLDLWHVPQAIEVLETLIEKDPQHFDAHMRLVECYAHASVGREVSTRTSLDRAREIARGGDGDTVLVNAVEDLFLRWDAERAATSLADLVRQDPQNIRTRYLLVIAQLRSGALEVAEKQLQDLLDGDPTLGRARELLVRCRMAQGNPQEAESEAKGLASIYPEEPYPYVLLSRVEASLGKVEEAVEFCNNALRIDHRYAPAIVSRANLYLREADPGAAAVSFEKLLLFEDPMLVSLANEGLANVAFRDGRFEEASQYMDEAIRLAMGEQSTTRGLQLAFRLVDYLCELGRTDSANQVIQRWFTPNGVIPSQIAKLRVLLSMPDASAANHAVEEIQKNEEWLAWLRVLDVRFDDIHAMTLIKGKRFSAALTELNGSSIALPPKASYLKGYALFQSGDAEAASLAFRQAMSRLDTVVFPYGSDPIVEVQSVFYLAEAAIARGDAAVAREHYERFLEFWGEADWQLQATARAREKLETLTAGEESSD